MDVKKNVFWICLGLCLLVVSGCGSLKLAPDEIQKQNAYLHNKTAKLVSELARQEQASADLLKASELSSVQSEAVLAYYGFPEKLPLVRDVDDLISEQNFDIAGNAFAKAQQNLDIWSVADTTMDIAIAIAGLFGGAAGIKFAALLKTAKLKSSALKEIVLGNEILKKQNPAIVNGFKEAHTKQSSATRQLVSEIKNNS